MSEERLQIMKMVEQGKLSAEEAVKLLDAVEAPAGRTGGPQPGRVRVQISEGTGSTHFVVSAALASWVLSLPGIARGGRLDRQGLLEALTNGAPGKIFEAAEGARKVEVWLEL